MNRWARLLALTLALGCEKTGPMGPPGPPGPEGPAGDAGPAGPDGMLLLNDVSGTVTDGTRPLEGVTVTATSAAAFPGKASTTTDAAGAFSFKSLPVEPYGFLFHLPGFAALEIDVSVPISPPVTLTAVLSRGDAGGGGPVVTVADQLTAGYGAMVSVPASASGNGPFTYAWTQTGGPAATLAGATTDTLAFTTQDFATSIGPVPIANARFGTLGISLDQANVYTFQLAVTDANGVTTTVPVTVGSARPSPGLRMVPVGIPVWLQGNGPLVPLGTPPAPQTTWAWTLDVTGASGSTATLAGASSQFATFTPDVAGTYVVKETVSGRSMNVYAGLWQGEMTAASRATCVLCHVNTTIAPDEFTPWMGTAHYASLQNGIEGSYGPAFGEACLSCHTVGYDRAAKNGGFDDVEAATGWTFPATDQPGNWAALTAVPALGQLAGIQCESCHGPQDDVTKNGPHANAQNPDLGARISWSAEVCASCHQDAARAYDHPALWSGSGHADRGLALREGTVENSPNAAHCGRCHSAQGYARYVAGLAQGYYGDLTSDGAPLSPANTVATAAELQGFGLTVAAVEPQTCAACHDPHSAANPSQIRVYDAIPALPNGMTGVSGMGSGALCITCHNSRNGEHTDFATQAANAAGILGPASLTGFTGPHAAAQGDVLFGFNAYFGDRYTPSPHLAVADTCVGCHEALVTASEADAGATSNHAFVADDTICQSCHAAAIDGAAVQAGHRAELDALRALFARKNLAPIAAALGAAPGATLVARAYDPATGLYSSASASTLDVVITGVPTAVTFTPISATPGAAYGPGVSAGLTLALPQPVTVQWVDASGSPAGGPVQVSSLTVPISALKLPPSGSGTQLTPWSAPTASAANVQVLYKAYWNLTLLNNDNTFGVHNPAFFTKVAAGTTAQLDALP